MMLTLNCKCELENHQWHSISDRYKACSDVIDKYSDYSILLYFGDLNILLLCFILYYVSQLIILFETIIAISNLTKHHQQKNATLVHLLLWLFAVACRLSNLVINVKRAVVKCQMTQMTYEMSNRFVV